MPQASSRAPHNPSISTDPLSHFRPLPTDFGNITMGGWNPAYSTSNQTSPYSAYSSPMMPQYQQSQEYSQGPEYGYADQTGNMGQQAMEYLNPNYWNEPVYHQGGLNSAQQLELLQSLETSGMGDIEMMIQASEQVFNPQSRTG